MGLLYKTNIRFVCSSQTGTPSSRQPHPATARQELRMPKLKPETMAARRDEILQAAEACFARQGFHQTTIADVIAQSGLSAGCIYGHFASKEELIQAIGEHRHARDAALLATAREISDPLEALRAIARASLADMQKEEGLRHRRIALQLWAEALRDDDIRAQVTDGVRKPAVLITELLQRGQRLGVIDRSVHPRSMARTIVAMFQGFVLQRLWGEPFSSSEAMAAFETLLTGLAARR
ncbi:TetR/AcrR family transcriptional regulator [Bradyrhizobium sp. SZCCHNRI3052]|uniref:TetR/AcrR family transcriptional regulator n=1 Tax=Bradyrhizobium sp. SZCCHNRI3052 TaxID=3057295 RepID=UPI0029170C8F|nr:TetR/AcrR family transcriptional regulator [Bradyrhizobium sp. SZCCHNRI3052]